MYIYIYIYMCVCICIGLTRVTPPPVSQAERARPPPRVPLATLSALLPRNLDGMHVCAELAGMVRV